MGPKYDSVELDTSEVKENLDSSINISNITTKSITWDSITLTWDVVEGASFYQIEVDGSKAWLILTTNIFTKRGLLPETEHTFRVRAVRGNSVSEWSGAMKGRTQKESFENSWWKECPDDTDDDMKYTVNVENPRIATKIGDGCIITGNTPLPPNKVTSWNIKILRSKNSIGNITNVGVGPSDINQHIADKDTSYSMWFLILETMISAHFPSSNDNSKEYGPRKGDGHYFHTVDNVGVVMDTTKGELSFVVDGVNLGVAHEGIPLDKPLVPCALLMGWQGDSIELDTSEVKENAVDSSIVISNSTAKNITWDSITLTWDAVEGALFYQIEADGSKFWDASTTNEFTKKELPPETEHTFRVRAVKGNAVSEWSGVVRGRTQKWECAWKECPGYLAKDRKYSVDGKNPRVASSICGFCTIIGNTPLPLNAVTSWSVKIARSRSKDSGGILIGVAPSNIGQNDNNFDKCGWHFYCYHSTLHSGPPHNYRGKEYGPRKNRGEYVHTGSIIGVTMDTAKGELSFALNGVNLGVAYEGIPLDKPLVPCALLKYREDSVELVI